MAQPAALKFELVASVDGMSLSLRDSGLSTLPATFGADLRSLSTLDLSRNQFKEVPETLFDLGELRGLDLSHNALSTLPADLARLRQLEWIDVRGNAFRRDPYVLQLMPWCRVIRA
jgi:internalin A|eukprot:TRINITY_DN4997_c0_g1_i1.p3 TRINITY_DN4997_c0_g1~~TRINITY_DN4997_c0_g1_i1.p3  ORF type:complete len:116 (+),score=33.26 TRINITY_DN4997_c0_g1_i1:35-382(+)